MNAGSAWALVETQTALLQRFMRLMSEINLRAALASGVAASSFLALGFALEALGHMSWALLIPLAIAISFLSTECCSCAVQAWLFHRALGKLTLVEARK